MLRCDERIATELRPIPGYEGLYSVTAYGRIWSHRRRDVLGRMCGGKWLKDAPHSAGYRSVVLTDIRGKQSTALIHRAVALAWIPNPDGLPHINHRDSTKTNNVISNLEWCTQSQNVQHGYDTGRRRESAKQREAARRAGIANRKLTMRDAKRIRSRSVHGERAADLAVAFGVSRITINRIVARRSYVNHKGESPDA